MLAACERQSSLTAALASPVQDWFRAVKRIAAVVPVPAVILRSGMALVTAWWAVWHIVSGLTVSTWWSRREPVS